MVHGDDGPDAVVGAEVIAPNGDIVNPPPAGAIVNGLSSPSPSSPVGSSFADVGGNVGIDTVGDCDIPPDGGPVAPPRVGADVLVVFDPEVHLPQPGHALSAVCPVCASVSDPQKS